MFNTTRMSKQLNNSFKETIVSDEALGLVKDYSELAMDSFLDEGTLKEIPILGTLFSIYKIGSSLRERHYIKKIIVFLNQLKDIPKKQREEFLSKLDNNDKFKESIFEKTLLLLERLDETHKAEMTGNLFRLFIMEVIDKDKLLRLSGIVERIALYDALALHFTHSLIDKDWEGIQPYSMSEASESSLYSLGLMEQKIAEKMVSRFGNVSTGIPSSPSYLIELKISSLGQEFANFILYDINNPEFIDHVINKYK